MPKQASLDAFFGGGLGKKKKAKTSSAKENARNKSNNQEESAAAQDLSRKKKKRILEESDEEEEPPRPVENSNNKADPTSKRRRRVIDDDDDDDDDKAVPNGDSEPMEENDDEEKADKDEKMTESNARKPKVSAFLSDVEEDGEKKETTETTKEKPKKKATASSSASASFFQHNKSSPSKGKRETTKAAKKKYADEGEEEPADGSTATSLPPPSDIMKAAPKGHFTSNSKVIEAMDKSLWPDESSTSTEVPYVVLCQVFSQIEEISGRLQIQDLLTTLFRQILLWREPQKNLNAILYLASNEVAPAYECVELGIGDAILVKAIGEATGNSTSQVKTKYDSKGDLGNVAMDFKSKQKTLGGFFVKAKPSNNNKKKKETGLTVPGVLNVFRDIAQTKGNQSQKWKVDSIKKLLVKATVGMETKYIIRGLQGKLRIGLSGQTVLVALAHALALTRVVPAIEEGKKEEDGDEEMTDKDKTLPDETKQYLDTSETVEKRLEGAVSIIKKAYSEVPSYDAVLDACLKYPLQELHHHCTLQPGIPVAPMLAKPEKSISAILKRLSGHKFTCEYKYDGERAQVHLLENGNTRVFSRNLLDTSEKYPEVPEFVREACRKDKGVKSFVMDAEVVAFNQKTGQLVPFQILSTRKKTQESNETAKVQVIVQAFDLMFLNGKSLLRQTLAERRKLLKEHFDPVEGKFQFAKSLDHQEDGDTTVLQEFLDEAVKGQCEGLMVKTLETNAIYEPSRRSLNWLKLKKDYLEGLGDSVDLVPLGAYRGKGKRTGFYGAYLLACYDEETEEFQSVCKIGTGFSDEDLKTLAETMDKHTIPSKSSQYNVTDQLECDVWFDAVAVWEVKAADLSKSSAHRGAVGKTGAADRGIGLRFPRFERVREDKKPVEATTSDQILEMYYSQDTVAGGGGEGEYDEEEDGI